MPLSALVHQVVTSVLPLSAEVVAAPAPVQLNPFGTLSTTLAWMVLVALNAWCFRRILRNQPTRSEVAG